MVVGTKGEGDREGVRETVGDGRGLSYLSARVAVVTCRRRRSYCQTSAAPIRRKMIRRAVTMYFTC
jgi:hypothetical protein